MASHADIRKTFQAIGQGHVFRFWDSLNEAQRAQLMSDCAGVNLERLKDLQRAVIEGERGASGAVEPAPMLELESAEFPYRLNKEAIDAAPEGERLLSGGKVACVLVAGGQGTRLGFDKPKGLLPIFPLSGRTLFDGFAAQLRAAGKRYGATPPLFVMTSDETYDETVSAFKSAKFYGLQPWHVRFFKQANNPALTSDGKLVLAEKHRLAVSPDGHGGCIAALARSGCLEDMARDGCEWISYFQVDNPAVRACDPAFIGLTAARDSDCSLKAVRKLDPSEKVGVFAYRTELPAIVEYTELSDEQSKQRLPDGSLAYKAGNTASHVFRRTFLERVARDAASLPYHLAFKAVPFVDDEGTVITPEKPNAYKFEQFIFDALPHAENAFALEIARGDEFLPVKSKDGPTSPVAVTAAMQALWRKQLRALGLEVSDTTPVEIAPEFRCDEAGLERAAQRLRAGGVVGETCLIEPE